MQYACKLNREHENLKEHIQTYKQQAYFNNRAHANFILIKNMQNLTEHDANFINSMHTYNTRAKQHAY